jgi:hypothetical protein
LLCPSAAMTFKLSVPDNPIPLTMRGKAGQMSSVYLAGVLGVQTSRRSRRRGDPKTRLLHLRHTCTSVCHSISVLTLDEFVWKSKISSRTSSGSTSIRFTWPTSYLSQPAVIAGCCATTDILLLDSVRFFRVRRRFFAISKP